MIQQSFVCQKDDGTGCTCKALLWATATVESILQKFEKMIRF